MTTEQFQFGTWYRHCRDRKRRRAMWNALQDACDNGPGRLHKNEIHPIWGMRAVRDFEKINGVEFDPFNSDHRWIISGKGRAKVYLAYMRDIVNALSPPPVSQER